MEDINAQLDTLYLDVVDQQKKASFKASLYQTLNILITIISIVSGTLIASLALSNFSWKNSANATLGIVVAVLKTLSAAMNLETKASTFKTLSVKLRQLTRKILQFDTQDVASINASLNQLYTTFDDLDTSLFNETNSLGRLVSVGEDLANMRGLHRNVGPRAIDRAKRPNLLPIEGV